MNSFSKRKLLFSRLLQPGRRSFVLSLFVAFNLLLLNDAALYGNPIGGSVAQGNANINSAGNTLTVTQSTQRAVINWNSFSIANGETTQFIFSNSNGATLNRVTGSNLSSIYGTLSSNGAVYLLNPNGIVIGPSGVINTAAFVASTLNVSDTQFMAGGSLLFSGNSTQSVVNLGKIGVGQGDVFLIAQHVENDGTINAPNGTVGLAGGTNVLIQPTGEQRLFVQPASLAGDAVNTGLIQAAAAELRAVGGNEYALAINNGGIIRATGTATIDGHIYLVATDGTASNTGTLQATNANGTGGTIDTSGENVIAHGTILTGAGGNWYLDPADLTIDSSAAATIDGSLNAGTNVTESTSSSGSGGTGTIWVVSNINWTTNASLTLSAYDNINVDATIQSTGGGNITLRADNTGAGFGGLGGAGNGTILNNSSGVLSTSGAMNLYFDPSSAALAGDTNVTIANGTSWWLVNNQAQLADVASGTGTHYALGANITLVGNWTPAVIGNVTVDGYGGIGYSSINNVTITSPGTGGTGLFAKLASAGFINNFTINNVSISGTNSSGTGALIGCNNGTINNVTANNVTIDGRSNAYIGGLVGQNLGTLTNATATNVTITNSSNYVGGLVGGSSVVLTNGTVINANIDGNHGSEIGGLVGYNDGGITNSHVSNSSITNGSTMIGGLVGYNDDDNGSFITNATVNNIVLNATSANIVGGLVGVNYAPITNGNVFNSTIINGATQIGGLVGANTQGGDNNSSGSVANSTVNNVTLNAHGAQYVGILVGCNDNGGTVANSTVYGSTLTDAGGYAGGLVGYSGGGSGLTNSLAMVSTGITDSTVTNTFLQGNGTADNVGGLAGYNNGIITNGNALNITITNVSSVIGGLIGCIDTGATVTDSTVTNVTINSGGSNQVGGLAGYNFGIITNGNVLNSTITNGYNDIGGLVGINSSGSTITNSTVTNVTFNGGGISSSIGGLVGDNQATITNGNVVNSSIINASSVVGGLVGYNEGGGSITDSTVTHTTLDGSGLASEVGGLVGYGVGSITNGNVVNSTITNVSSLGGGFIGYNDSGVTNSSVQNIIMNLMGGDSGGFVGENTSNITNAYVTGTLASITSISNLGGFVGNNNSGGTITESYATVNVTAANSTVNNVGGFAGYNNYNINNAYSVGNVAGGTSVGGFVGYNDTGGNIATVYTAGAVTAGTTVGGLAGTNVDTILNSYWASSGTPGAQTATLTVGSGSDASVNGVTGTTVGATTYASMQGNQSTFATPDWTAGFSSGLWGFLGSSINNNLPVFTANYSVITITIGNFSVGYGTTMNSGTFTVSTGSNVTVTVGGVTNPFATDAADFNTTPTFTTTGSSTPNAGTYASSLGLTSVSGTGSYAGYAINYVTSGAVLTITPAALTITVSGATKTYGTTSYSTTLASSGLQYSDTLTGVTVSSGGQNTYDTVGTYAITGATNAAGTSNGVGGTSELANNYTITYVTSGAVLNVTKANLTLTATNTSAAYGTTITSLGSYTETGLVSGDTITSVTLTSSGGATPSAGSYNITYVTGAETNGAGTTGLNLSTNYNITYATGVLTVTPAALTITVSGATKTYGTTSYSTTLASSGLQYSDTLTGVTVSSGGQSTYSTVGTYAITGATNATGTSNGVGGTSELANNYTITYVTSGAVLNVTKANLTLTATNTSAAYGTTITSLDSYTETGLVSGDTITSVTLTSSGGATPSAGSYNITYVTGAETNGAGTTGLNLSTNYNITYATGTLTVTPAALSITLSGATKTYGSTTITPAFSSITGLKYADTLTGVTLTSAGSGSSANAGTYTITGATNATGTSNGVGGTSGLANNYTITYVTTGTVLTVDPASLTVTANATSKNAGTTLSPTSLTYSVSGLVGSDTFSGVTFTSTGLSSAAAAGTYSIIPSGGSASPTPGNYTLSYVDGTLTVNASITSTITLAQAQTSQMQTGPEVSASIEFILDPFSSHFLFAYAHRVHKDPTALLYLSSADFADFVVVKNMVVPNGHNMEFIVRTPGAH